MKGAPLSIVGEALGPLRAYRARPAPRGVKLDANESPWPLPEHARRRLAEVLAEAPLHRYPDGSASELKEALAARLGAAPEELLVGAGSDEVIAMLMTAFDRPRGGRPASVLFPTPTFVMYPITARVHGLLPVGVPLGLGFELDEEAMRRALAEHAPNLVFLASPNNPTGNRFDDEAIARVVEAAPEALVVIDEAYAPFAGRSLGGWVPRHANVGVMGTLSKVGLAGLRVGWIRMAPALVREAEKARPPYNLSVLAQRSATLLLTELSCVLEDQVRRIVAAREELGVALGRIDDVRVTPSEANFFLVEVGDAARVHRALLEQGVQVRRFNGEPRLVRHLRITVGTREENERLLSALSEGIGALSPSPHG